MRGRRGKGGGPLEGGEGRGGWEGGAVVPHISQTFLRYVDVIAIELRGILTRCTPMQGPEIGGVLELLNLENGDVSDSSNFVKLEDRIPVLKDWLANQV